MRKVVVFGISRIAEVLYQTVLADDKSDIIIEAFCVDREYRKTDRKYNLPVVDFETVVNDYSPRDYEMIVAIGYHDMNQIREKKCKQAMDIGYSLPGYVHSDVMITEDVRIGNNVLIFNNVCVGSQCEIGDDTVAFAGAIISHHATIGNHNWITSGTVIGGGTTTGNNCFFGIGSSVGHNISIGNMNFIGQNAVVTKSTEDNGVYILGDTPRYRLDTEKFMKLFKFD